MKKLLALFLMLAMLMCCTVPVSAVESQKISKESLEIIENAADDELITIILCLEFEKEFYNNMGYVVAKGYDTEKYYTDPEYKEQCDKEWRAYVEDFKAQNHKEMMELYHEVFGDDTENLLECLDLGRTMMIKATKSEIYMAAEFPVVSFLYVYNESESEDTTASDSVSLLLKEAFLKYEGVASNNEAREELQIYYYGAADDYYVFRPNKNFPSLMTEQRIGDYLFSYGAIAGNENENPVGLYVADKDGNVEILKYAFEKGLVDIRKIAQIVPYCQLFGDADGDGTLTIRDATYIQKMVAGLATTFEGREIITSTSPDDMNEDGVVNIKDATAIQKYLAGIE